MIIIYNHYHTQEYYKQTLKQVIRTKWCKREIKTNTYYMLSLITRHQGRFFSEIEQIMPSQAKPSHHQMRGRVFSRVNAKGLKLPFKRICPRKGDSSVGTILFYLFIFSLCSQTKSLIRLHQMNLNQGHARFFKRKKG